MSTFVVLATADSQLATAWERQLPPGRTVLLLGAQEFSGGTPAGFAAVVILDAAAEAMLPIALIRSPTIYVGEPRSLPFEQARLAGRAKAYLSYEESASRLRELFPLLEELAEKQSMLDLMVEKNRRLELPRLSTRAPPAAPDAAEWWDFLEGAVETIDTRERLIRGIPPGFPAICCEHRHAVFFFCAIATYSKRIAAPLTFAVDDPIVRFFETHPAVIDGNFWEVQTDPHGGARRAQPFGPVGSPAYWCRFTTMAACSGLIASRSVRDDGQPYDFADRARAVHFARLLRQCLSKSAQMNRLSLLADHAVMGAKYFPNTIVLAPNENAPRNVPVAVRDLVGRARRTRAVCRLTPTESQPYRASAGLIAETGGVWAFWEEASAEVQDAAIRQRIARRGLLREIALTLSHELGNGLVSLATLRQYGPSKPPPQQLLETVRSDIVRFEALNRQVGVMQTLHESEASEVDVRELAQGVGTAVGITVEVGPDPVKLLIAKDLVEFGLRSLIETIAENRPAARDS